MFIDNQIYQALSSSQELMACVNGIYHTMAPYDAQTPYVVFYVANGEDNYTLGGRYRTVLRYEFLVFGYMHELSAIHQAADIIDSILNDAVLENTVYLRREGVRLPVLMSVGGEGIVGVTLIYRAEVI